MCIRDSIIGRKIGHTAATWFTFGLLLYCTILIITASIGETYEEHYPWTELFGEFGFLLDGLAAPFAIIIYVLCTILALYSKPYMLHKFHEFFKQKTAYEIGVRLVGSEMCIRDRFAIMIYVLCTILALYSKPYMLHKFQAVSYTHLTLPTILLV